MVKLIELYGPANSGKTTVMYGIAEQLAKDGVRCVTIQEAIRHLNLNLGELLKTIDGKKKLQVEIFKKQKDLLLKSLDNVDVIVSDRSLYDFLVYTDLYIGDMNFTNMYKELVEIFYTYMGVEDHYIFYLKSVGFKSDGLRYSLDYEQEKQFFEEWSDYACAYNIETTNHQERLNIILENVK